MLKQIILVASLIAVVASGCDKGVIDPFGTTRTNQATGNLTRNGQAGIFFTNTGSASLNNSAQTARVSVSNYFPTNPFGGGSSDFIQNLSFTIPLNQVGQVVTLSSTSASFTETPPPNNAQGSPVTVAFTSTQATGTLTLFSFFDDPALLNPDHAQGIFDVTFTDGQGNTRQISNGLINF